MVKDPLKTMGLIMMIVGFVILLSAFPMIEQSAIKIAGVAEITDIPPISATRIAIGAVLILLGLVVYFGKDGLKIITHR